MATKNELKSLTKKRQSPIDICDEIVHPKCLPPLKLIGHWCNDGEAILMNNGLYAMVHLTGDRIPSIIKCGPLQDEYELHHAHFHWGEDDYCGSEHSLNGTWFSMEAHVVHWNRKYPTFEECLKYEDGICVLAYFFLVTDACDCESFATMERITDYLQCIIKINSKIKISPTSLSWMRAATECKSYYFYNGSYNFGDHPECTIWIIFPKVIPIKADQIAPFRKLKNEKGKDMKCNRRATQHLYDRKIYKAVLK